MEIFFEQNVDNPNIDKHKKRTTVLSVLSKVFLVLGIVLAIVGIGGIALPSGGNVVLTIALQIVFSLLMGAPFVLAFFLIRRFLRQSNAEFDYILNGNILRIVRITMRVKRKLLATVPMDCVESIGRITCESYERNAANKSIKKQYAVCHYEEEENLAYIRYRSNGEDFLLHIEPNEEMVTALRRSLPRISIMDKSMNMPVTPKKEQ